jgi:hypothetical protein
VVTEHTQLVSDSYRTVLIFLALSSCDVQLISSVASMNILSTIHHKHFSFQFELFCFSMNLVLSQHSNQKSLTPTMTFFSLFSLFSPLCCCFSDSRALSFYLLRGFCIIPMLPFLHTNIPLGPDLLGHACKPVARVFFSHHRVSHAPSNILDLSIAIYDANGKNWGKNSLLSI